LVSKSQIDKLGQRLRTGASPTQVDLLALKEYVDFHGQVLGDVVQKLRLVPARSNEITARLKTTETIIEKLRRQRVRLSQIQDIAGARVVVPLGRLGQDDFVEKLLRQWPSHTVEDRREKPQHGYRAVHIIVREQQRTVEIQVRTERQHQWADLFEKLADRWGRQIRYGGAPNIPPAKPGDQTIQYLRELSDHIDLFERVEAAYGGRATNDSVAKLGEVLDRLKRELELL